MAFNAGTIRADLRLDRTEFTRGLETARNQVRRFAATPLEKKIKVTTQVNKGNFQLFSRQLEQFRKSTFRATVGVDMDSAERAQFSQLRNSLRSFDSRNYTATARVNTRQAERNVRSLGDTIGGYFTKVSQRAFRTSLVRMAAFRTAGSAAITGIVPAIAAATAAAGGLASTLGTAAAGAAAFAAVAVPQIQSVTDAVEDGKVQFEELESALHPLGRAVQGVMDSFQQLQDATRGAVTDALVAGAQALSNLFPTLEPLVNATAAAFERMGNALNDAFQTQGFQDFVDFLSENVGPVMDELFRIVVNLARGIGGLMQAFMPLGQGLLESIANGMERFATWAQNLGNNTSFQQFLDYANQALPLMWDFITSLVGAFGNLAGSLAEIGMDVVQGITWLLDTIQNADPKILAAVALGLSSIVAAIGVGLGPMAIAAAGGIAALVGAMSNMQGGVEGLSGPLRRIVTFFQDLWNKVVEVSTAIWENIQPALSELWDMIQNQLAPAFADFLEAIKPIVNWFLDVLGPIVSSVITDIIDIFKGLVQFIQGVLQFFTGIFTGNWSKVWEGIKNIVGGAVRAVWNFLMVWLVGRAVKAVGAFFKWIGRLFQRGWQSVVNFAQGALRGLASFIQGILNNIGRFFRNIWQGIWNWFRNILRNIRNFFRNIWQGISDWLNTQLIRFSQMWNNAWNGVANAFSRIFGGIVQTAKNIWNGVKNAFRSGINAVTGFVNDWFIGPINKVLGVFDLKIPKIPQLAQGGKLTQEVEMMASGGQIGGGFKTNKPTAIVGEGSSTHPEYVIPTDPKHRGRAQALHAEAGRRMMATGGVVSGRRAQGTQMMQDGGVLGWLSDLGSSAWQGIKSVGSGLKWLGQKSWDMIKKGAGWIMDNTVGPIVNKVKDLIPDHLLGRVAEGSIDKAYGGIRDFLGTKEEEVKKAGEEMQRSGGGANAAARPASQWAPVARRALNMLGMPQSWLGATLQQIQIESGGNPNAINLWDINAQRGMPSQGLLQTIPPTFRSNMVPGFGNITAPLDNILAALNYTVGRYGSVPNIWPTRAGYDNGGDLQPGWNLAYNGTGRTENVQSPGTEDALVRKLDEISRKLDEQQPVSFNIGHATPDTAQEFADKVLTRMRHRRKESRSRT